MLLLARSGIGKLRTATALGLRGCLAVATSYAVKRSGLVNSIWYQRRVWREQAASSTPAEWEALALAWGGEPGNPHDRLGDYRRVLDLLQQRVHPQARLLEIGSFVGKWTAYLLAARSVTAVDLFDHSHEVLRRRFGDPPNLRFYRTGGDELHGVESGSIDTVFSVDSLVRAPKPAIARYLAEIHRVLAPGGLAILHLPCDEFEHCRRARFTALSRAELDRLVRDAGFADTTLDAATLNHGLLALARKGATG